ncbi:hypothetical protein IGI37_002165 [Enterococcus sp. AZ194]|uniref:rhodanese-like domain-containing protein n=1 Tax=Enterococcus sp. AZ194 TaxID=2774629 RepID=UPI003F26E359
MFKTISMPEFYQLSKQNQLNVIDVREADEYVVEHLSNATNYPLSQLNCQFKQLDKRQTYYLICQSGSRSMTACQFLSSQGYEVTNVLGGISSWLGELVS